MPKSLIVHLRCSPAFALQTFSTRVQWGAIGFCSSINLSIMGLFSVAEISLGVDSVVVVKEERSLMIKGESRLFVHFCFHSAGVKTFGSVL